MFILTIPRNALAAVSRFMAKQDLRCYINGLHVEKYANIAYIVATDGSALCVGRIESDGAGQGSYIIPREFVEKIKANGNNGLPIILSVADPDASGVVEFTLNDCGMKTSGKCIDGRFPDWRNVIPSECSGEAGNFNPELLMRCQKASQDMGSKHGYFGFAQNGKNSAALASISDGELLAVIMPMRAEPTTMPEWRGENPEAVGRECNVDKAWDAAIEFDACKFAMAA